MQPQLHRHCCSRAWGRRAQCPRPELCLLGQKACFSFVLAPSGCNDQPPWPDGLSTTDVYFSDQGSSRLSVCQGSASWFIQYLLSVSSPGGRGWSSLGPPLQGCYVRGSTSSPPPKGSPSDTITLGVRFYHELLKMWAFRKALTNLDNVLKSRDVTLLTKMCVVRAMVFQVVMYRCESWP